MQCITPKDFLKTVFPAELLRDDEAAVVCYPSSFVDQAGRSVTYHKQVSFRGRQSIPVDIAATYYCVSSCEYQGPGRQARRRLVDVRDAYVLPCDDIGTKADAPPVLPSYVIETSLGNYQWGYLLDPYPVNTREGQYYYDSVLYTLANMGFNDPGCRGATREVRLPGSLHKTGFISRIVEWHPDRVWALEQLVKDLGIKNLDKPRRPPTVKPGRHSRLEDVADPAYEYLLASEHPIYGQNESWVFLECPWRDTHTDRAQGPTATAYSPIDYGTQGSGFRCMHAHCVHRTAQDFMEWAVQRRNAALIAMRTADCEEA